MSTTEGTGYLDSLRQLPRVDPASLLRGRALVVIAPHPDDESLGMGGLLASSHAMGCEVSVVFLTDGEGSHVGSLSYPPARLATLRQHEARAALAELGLPASCAHFLGLGDTRVGRLTESERVRAASFLQAMIPQPALVCVTASTDPHGDHQGASALVAHVAWGDGVEVMHYPVWTWMQSPDALPAYAATGYRVDVSAHLPEKRRAIAAHRSQHGEIIMDAAEAFELSPAFVQHFLDGMETLVWPT